MFANLTDETGGTAAMSREAIASLGEVDDVRFGSGTLDVKYHFIHDSNYNLLRGDQQGNELRVLRASHRRGGIAAAVE